MPGRRGSAGKTRHYLPLLDALAAMLAEHAVVTVTFAELETLLGCPLSQSARSVGWYWSSSRVAQLNWIRAGWSARLNRLDRAVTFTRR